MNIRPSNYRRTHFDSDSFARQIDTCNAVNSRFPRLFCSFLLSLMHLRMHLFDKIIENRCIWPYLHHFESKDKKIAEISKTICW